MIELPQQVITFTLPDGSEVGMTAMHNGREVLIHATTLKAPESPLHAKVAFAAIVRGILANHQE